MHFYNKQQYLDSFNREVNRLQSLGYDAEVAKKIVDKTRPENVPALVYWLCFVLGWRQFSNLGDIPQVFAEIARSRDHRKMKREFDRLGFHYYREFFNQRNCFELLDGLSEALFHHVPHKQDVHAKGGCHDI